MLLLPDMISRDSVLMQATAHSSSHVRNYYFENMLPCLRLEPGNTPPPLPLPPLALANCCNAVTLHNIPPIKCYYIIATSLNHAGKNGQVGFSHHSNLSSHVNCMAAVPSEFGFYWIWYTKWLLMKVWSVRCEASVLQWDGYWFPVTVSSPSWAPRLLSEDAWRWWWEPLAMSPWGPRTGGWHEPGPGRFPGGHAAWRITHTYTQCVRR